MRFTVDVTMQLAFGVDANTLETPGPVIQQHLDKVFPVLHRRVNAAFPWWRYIRLPSDRVLDRALVALEREVGDMVRATRERMAAEPKRRDAPTNFLEAILAAVEAEESGFTDAEIFANAGTLLLAGEDTTANSMAWTVHYFTKYPEHFERVRYEVDAVVAPEPAIGSLDQTTELPFLDAFCNEVMRLKPVAPLHVVEPVADATILGCAIPKGTPIMMLVRRMATRDENFGAGSRFDPDRWLVPAEERSIPHDHRAFVPFGAGPRLCPGRSLALLQIRTVLAMLCRNFQVEPVRGGKDVDEYLAFTMMPSNLSVPSSAIAQVSDESLLPLVVEARVRQTIVGSGSRTCSIQSLRLSRGSGGRRSRRACGVRLVPPLQCGGADQQATGLRMRTGLTELSRC